MSDTKAVLIDAAKAHLDARGLPGLTLRQIARDAGVSHGAPLRHFSGLGELLATVAAEAFDALAASVDLHVADAGPRAEAQLAAAGRGYVAFAVANPGVYELMFRPDLLDTDEPDYRRASTAAFERLASLAAAAQAAGWRSGLDPAALTGVLWAGVHGLASLWIQRALPAATGVDSVDVFLGVFQGDLAGLPIPDRPSTDPTGDI